LFHIIYKTRSCIGIVNSSIKQLGLSSSVVFIAYLADVWLRRNNSWQLGVIFTSRWWKDHSTLRSISNDLSSNYLTFVNSLNRLWAVSHRLCLLLPLLDPFIHSYWSCSGTDLWRQLAVPLWLVFIGCKPYFKLGISFRCSLKSLNFIFVVWVLTEILLLFLRLPIVICVGSVRWELMRHLFFMSFAVVSNSMRLNRNVLSMASVRL
jgi:hypothetical protein